VDLPSFGIAYKDETPGFETLLLPYTKASHNDGDVFVQGSSCTYPPPAGACAWR
jgi:hypothetical protein